MASTTERRPLLRTTPPGVSRWKNRVACVAVLLTEIFERIAFYGVVGNLVLFLNLKPYLWESYNASTALFILTGISYMTSILGGWIADSCLGRFRTIQVFFVVCLGGYSILPALYPYPEVDWGGDSNTNAAQIKAPSWCRTNTCDYTDSNNTANVTQPPGQECCAWAIFLSLVLIGLGTSVIKANIAPFGADQVRHLGPHTTRVFFNWFYWCINIGSLIALGPLAYIQQEISFFWGYIVPAACLFVAALVFVLGGPNYIRPKPSGSVLRNIMKVIVEACSLGCRKKNRCRAVGRSDADGISEAGSSEIDTSHGFLDNAKVQFGGSFHESFVDDVKTLLKVTCIFLTLIPYWIVYMQMETTFLTQGLHMRLDLFGNISSSTDSGNNVFMIPAASLTLFDVILIIVLIPLMDRILYPCFDRRGHPISMRVRMGVGMIFAILAVTTAGVVENYRRSVVWQNESAHNITQYIAGTPYYAANVTILLQIPQYAMIGVSEVFTSVAGLEFAYREAPRPFQSIIMGLYLLGEGAGSMLGSGLMSIFQGTWFFSKDHGNIDYWRLDYYFFVLAGLQVFGLLIFIVVIVYLGMGRNDIRLSRSLTQPTSTKSRVLISESSRHVQNEIT